MLLEKLGATEEQASFRFMQCIEQSEKEGKGLNGWDQTTQNEGDKETVDGRIGCINLSK